MAEAQTLTYDPTEQAEGELTEEEKYNTASAFAEGCIDAFNAGRSDDGCKTSSPEDGSVHSTASIKQAYRGYPHGFNSFHA